MNDLRHAAIVDFEAFPIVARPSYPPEPVGVAISVPGRKSKYYAWAHPLGGNTCTWAEARAALGEVWDSGRDVAFHNAKFDLSVSVHKMGLPMLPWKRIYDTMLMLFLDDPRVATFALKPSADRLLGLPPDERNAVEEWLLEHQPVPGVKLSPSRKSEWYAGGFIAYAPVSLVGPYAIGDVDRTRAIGNLLLPRLAQRRMLEAYDRERKLISIAMELEEQGVRVAHARLAKDVDLYGDVAQRLDKWLCQRLKVPADTNLNSGSELVKALVKGKAVDTTKLGVTKTGKDQTNKEALGRAITDKQVEAALIYRAKLKTNLGTFMEPWLETANRSGGYIFTEWHSTRTDENGTKSGRFSSSRFQNMSKELEEPLFADADHPLLPKAPIALPKVYLPLIRGYVTTYEDGDVLIDRDYSQQEYRILAHFEGGALMRAYLENPWIDLHEHSRLLINDLLHANFTRKPVKNTGFGILYGLGLEKLALKNKCTVEVADQLRKAFKQIYPGLKDIQEVLKQRERDHEPVRTWGGREYFCEEPKLVTLPNGAKKLQTYGYRMLNYLIQPSAADCTKEALVRYWEHKPVNHRVLTIPHDEFLVSVPAKERDVGMELLRLNMESVEFSVPMLSDGKWSPTDWATLKTYDKAGKRCV
jgi:DNA polymerase I-like protein with 3'-5' exonuclease and polymerase domains